MLRPIDRFAIVGYTMLTRWRESGRSDIASDVAVSLCACQSAFGARTRVKAMSDADAVVFAGAADVGLPGVPTAMMSLVIGFLTACIQVRSCGIKD